MEIRSCSEKQNTQRKSRKISEYLRLCLSLGTFFRRVFRGRSMNPVPARIYRAGAQKRRNAL